MQSTSPPPLPAAMFPFNPTTPERSMIVFTRVVELTSKPGKASELSNAINEKAVPILKTQPGFVDEVLLVSNAEPDRVLALSFWKTREDAERYHREQFKKISEMLGYLFQTEPMIRTFDVHTSSGLKIVAGRAA
jgi:heme-degrading monooxygenase HmoA